MKFESKYNVGQKLWEIRQHLDTNLDRCPLCNGTVFYNKQWMLLHSEEMILSVSIKEGSVYYQTLHRDMLSESEIGQRYFATKEEALSAIYRLNERIVESEIEALIPLANKLTQDQIAIIFSRVFDGEDSEEKWGSADVRNYQVIGEVLNAFQDLFETHKNRED